MIVSPIAVEEICFCFAFSSTRLQQDIDPTYPNHTRCCLEIHCNLNKRKGHLTVDIVVEHTYEGVSRMLYPRKMPVSWLVDIRLGKLGNDDIQNGMVRGLKESDSL